ncbi:MAG: RsmE family RNA methyltransferase [Candidatus Paceibacterota bacterium]|nr:RsmE family RNA methyltransferase [Candidatus Paceibacterota bacterium]MDD4999242.1 RsmE family RNA methyltransferase [Candidatus Paceibacterota bacterium]
MKNYRFFIEKNFEKNKIIYLSEEELINQLKNVLRLKAKDKIIIFNNQEKEVLAEIVEINKNFIKIKILKILENQNESLSRKTILYCSILKKENFELVVQKATEIGVKSIVPLITKRTVKQNFKEERLKKIIKEASEQSERISLPILNKILTFEKAIKESLNNDINLFFERRGMNISELRKLKAEKVGVFIGPEGGFTDEELALAKANNHKIISLGKLNLRAETAAIIGSYLAENFLSPL